MSFYPLSEPITKTVITTYTSYTINNIVITPFIQATMMIELFSEDKTAVCSQYLCMQGNDYADWQGDDAYLINWVNLQLEEMQKNINV